MSQLSPRETQEERVSSSSFSSVRPSPSFSAGLSFSSAFPVKVGESRSLFSTGSTCSCERLVLQRSPAKDVVKKEKKSYFKSSYTLSDLCHSGELLAFILSVLSKIINTHQLFAAGLFKEQEGDCCEIVVWMPNAVGFYMADNRRVGMFYARGKGQ